MKIAITFVWITPYGVLFCMIVGKKYVSLHFWCFFHICPESHQSLGYHFAIRKVQFANLVRRPSSLYVDLYFGQALKADKSSVEDICVNGGILIVGQP